MRLLLFYRRYTYRVSLYLIHVSLLSSPFFPSPSPLYFYERAYRGITQREFNRKEKKKKNKKEIEFYRDWHFFFPPFLLFSLHAKRDRSASGRNKNVYAVCKGIAFARRENEENMDGEEDTREGEIGRDIC